MKVTTLINSICILIIMVMGYDYFTNQRPKIQAAERNHPFNVSHQASMTMDSLKIKLYHAPITDKYIALKGVRIVKIDTLLFKLEYQLDRYDTVHNYKNTEILIKENE